MKAHHERDRNDDAAHTQARQGGAAGKTTRTQRLASRGDAAGASAVVQASLAPGVESLGADAGNLEEHMSAALRGEASDADAPAAADEQGMRSSRFRGLSLIEQAFAGQTLLRQGCPDRQAVSAVQTALNGLNHDCGTVDGLWGNNTTRGVRSFQQAFGLDVDAIIGALTMAALDLADALGGGGSKPPQPGPPGPGPGPGPGQGTADEWHKAYGSRKTYLGQEYDDYKAGIGRMGASSEHGGRKRDIIALNLDQLFYIFPDLAADAQGDSEIMGKAKAYLDHLNQAFEIMEIDTIEAQAVYLAHASVESNQFRQLTEAQTEHYVDDPTQAKLFTGSLEKLYPAGSSNGRSINPTGEWSFIGRGPLQVTHRYGFIQTLAHLEKKAEQYEATGDTEKAALLREAATEIKRDPRQASNPKYTFVFSAAYMKMMDGDQKVLSPGPKTFTGTGGESSWMTGGNYDKQHALKRQAYERALEALAG